jgi:hypothetical protein
VDGAGPSAVGETSLREAEPASDGASSRQGADGLLDSPQGAAAPSTPKGKVKGARQRNLFIDAPREQLAFLERIIQQLQEAGASNVRIDHSTDRWMVLVVDAK